MLRFSMYQNCQKSGINATAVIQSIRLKEKYLMVKYETRNKF
ncbi:hypothetical protein KsCSTR_18880 [Candidatus Kuenenia stuttgartiensis]|uniref:Uncharacterized protein n=1 Tax=Kuenenia stuttgartiensis TaxID=174633 RepID=A0A6G7GPZ6_KUEST|nr:hypothetical protein KsCSTR_18880 [Candidatus Kuenenia stuttgartiensis]